MRSEQSVNLSPTKLHVRQLEVNNTTLKRRVTELEIQKKNLLESCKELMAWASQTAAQTGGETPPLPEGWQTFQETIARAEDPWLNKRMPPI